MNDEETAALTCGGHTVGKAHGRDALVDKIGAEPEGSSAIHGSGPWLVQPRSRRQGQPTRSHPGSKGLVKRAHEVRHGVF